MPNEPKFVFYSHVSEIQARKALYEKARDIARGLGLGGNPIAVCEDYAAVRLPEGWYIFAFTHTGWPTRFRLIAHRYSARDREVRFGPGEGFEAFLLRWHLEDFLEDNIPVIEA